MDLGGSLAEVAEQGFGGGDDAGPGLDFDCPVAPGSLDEFSVDQQDWRSIRRLTASVASESRVVVDGTALQIAAEFAGVRCNRGRGHGLQTVRSCLMHSSSAILRPSSYLSIAFDIARSR